MVNKITVWEKTDNDSEAIEREFDAPEEIETATDYCRWANTNAGRDIYFTSNPDEN